MASIFYVYAFVVKIPYLNDIILLAWWRTTVRWLQQWLENAATAEGAVVQASHWRGAESHASDAAQCRSERERCVECQRWCVPASTSCKLPTVATYTGTDEPESIPPIKLLDPPEET
jgi:hypothetical protein